jgi:asparagine synthase (glutamine-hydrolysing)
LPRPAGRLFEQESMRISEDLAAHVDAQAVMTGGGGDNVFCSLQSAAPVVDRLRAQGPSKGIFDTAREMALLASVSVPTVLWAALGRWVRSGRGSPPEPDLSLLAPAARDVTRATPHRWLVAPSGAHPGKAAHVKLLAAAESFMQGFDPEGDLPTVAPLLAQPVVETCLAIPSWQWFAGGLNRAIARRAFERDLPELIVRRVSKGTPDTFAAEIYERYRVALRERLLGGVLAAERLLDIATVERAFVQSGSLAPANYRRLLRLADVEVWARTWIGRAS